MSESISGGSLPSMLLIPGPPCRNFADPPIALQRTGRASRRQPNRAPAPPGEFVTRRRCRILASAVMPATPAAQWQGRKNVVAKAESGVQASAGVQRKCERPTPGRLGVGDGADVDKQRASNAHESQRAQRRVESLDRLARDVLGVADPVLDI